MAKVDEIAAQVAALDQQLRAASKQAAHINTRESLLGRPITDYSQVKQLTDVFDPFLQFWTTAAAWKVRTPSSCGPWSAAVLTSGAAIAHICDQRPVVRAASCHDLAASFSHL
jgi:hypothetical protein